VPAGERQAKNVSVTIISAKKKTPKENLEADDKGVQLGAELFGGLGLDEVPLSHGGDEGGVEAAGEEDPERDVSHEPLDNRLQRTGIGHMARSVSVTAVLLVTTDRPNKLRHAKLSCNKVTPSRRPL
jgi:hypothetical protein